MSAYERVDCIKRYPLGYLEIARSIHVFSFMLSATAAELDRQLQALLKDLVMTQPEVVIPEVQLHCKDLMVNFNRYSKISVFIYTSITKEN